MEGEEVMNHSLANIFSSLEQHFGAVPIQSAQRIHAIFSSHRDFWLDSEADRRLRIALFAEISQFAGQDAESSRKLTDSLIRDGAGVPQVEDDTDPIYPYYKERAGARLLLDDETAIRIIGPCPASPFRWAVVERISDHQRWTISWFVLTKLRVLDQAATDAPDETGFTRRNQKD